MGAPFADRELARLLEGVEATEASCYIETARHLDPGVDVEVMQVSGGAAVWAGDGLPVNKAIGLGLSGAGAAGLDEIEAFYRRRGAGTRIQLSPFADDELVRELAARGYRVTGFENVLVRSLDDLEPEPAPPQGVEVRIAGPADRDAWCDAVVRNFSELDSPEDWEWWLGRIMLARAGTTGVLAWCDGRVVGTGELAVRGEVGWLNGDTTKPGYRGRGIQQAVQRRRLSLARDAGCRLAVSEALPGSTSQRNMERCGLRVAYTRVEMDLPASAPLAG